MNMFRFAHPEYLNGFFILALVATLIYIVFFLKKKQIKKFSDKKLLKKLAPEHSYVKFFIRSGLVLLASAFLIIAAANPQVGSKIEEVKQTGIDIFILLDVSKSMIAEDIKPSRLAKAKNDISNLIEKLKGNRIGLIIFSGDAYVQFPLTTDYSAANLFLNAVNTNSVPSQGTAIAPAINLAVQSFPDDQKTQRAIIIMTDGEDHEGDVDQAVNEAVEKGCSVFAIGFGSPGGAPIPVYDARGNRIGYKKDNADNTVLSKLNEIELRRIAEQGNGIYYRASNASSDLDAIYNEISGIEKTEFGARQVTDYEDRYYYFLAPAILILLIEFFLSDRRSKYWVRLNRKLGIEDN